MMLYDDLSDGSSSSDCTMVYGIEVCDTLMMSITDVIDELW